MNEVVISGDYVVFPRALPLFQSSQLNGSSDDLHILHVFVTRLGKLKHNSKKTKLGYLKVALFLYKIDEELWPSSKKTHIMVHSMMGQDMTLKISNTNKILIFDTSKV